MKQLFILYVIALISCKTNKDINQQVINKVILDPNSFEVEFNNAIKNSNIDSIVFKAGTYNVKSKLYDGVLTRDISIIGDGKVTINVTKEFIQLQSPKILEGKIIQNLSRGSKVIKVKDALPISYLNNSLLFFIRSDSSVEEGWKYKKGELQEITFFKGETLSLKDGLKFNYAYSENAQIHIYDSKKIILKNIDFKVNCESNWSYDNVIRTDGCRIFAEDITINNCYNERKGWFWGMYYCNDIFVNDFNCNNISYGLVMNYCKNVVVKNIISNNTEHPIVPATFTQNVYVSNLRGENTNIDAHPSFDVHYNDIDIDTGLDLFNCRSYGVTLTNCNFRCSSDNDRSSIYIGGIALKKEYEFLYDEFDIILKNVRWKHKIIGFNGLTVNRCNKFIVDSCETHMISTGNFIKSVEISNSKIGYFKCYDTNFKITNSKFIRSLQNLKITKPPLACSFSGSAEIVNCDFNGYNDYLLEFVSGPNSKILFKGCNIIGIQELVKQFQFPTNNYSNIEFINCELPNLKQIPSQMEMQKKSILKNNKLKLQK